MIICYTQFLCLVQPSSPRNITHAIPRHGMSVYLVSVWWEAPVDDGGAEVSSYTISVRTDGMADSTIGTTNSTSQVVSLQYNKKYVLRITATNCNWIGLPASLDICEGSRCLQSYKAICNLTVYIFYWYVASCGLPSPPANGTIEPYNSTEVGAEVQYHCDEGHTPREWRTSECQENGTWTPNPALLNCAMGMHMFHIKSMKNIFQKCRGM